MFWTNNLTDNKLYSIVMKIAISKWTKNKKTKSFAKLMKKDELCFKK